MRVMSLDCEFNQPSRKTIEIGAAVFDVKSGELIEKFQTHVNPGEPITQFITELTRITDKDVQNAPQMLEAFQMLQAFHKKNKVFMNPIVWGAGSSNDSLALYNETYPTKETKEEHPNFMGYRIIDAKTLYQSLRMFQNKQIKGGLKTACTEKGMNIGWDDRFGQNHGALADALNTFRIWHYMMIRFNNGVRIGV